MDAIFRDFFAEQKNYMAQTMPTDVDPTNWGVIQGVTNVLDNTLNQTGKPDIGIVHGPVVQGYFYHLQRVVNDGGVIGDISATDIHEHLGLLSPTKMFENHQTVCPVKDMFIAAAIGVGHKSTTTRGAGHQARAEQRLWTVYQRAQNEAGELQQLVTSSLDKRFDIAVRCMRGDYLLPQPRILKAKPAGDLSVGQS